MSSKNHRDGGKFRGHTTVIDAAIPVLDALSALDVVTGISIGIIEKTKSVSAIVVNYKLTVSGFEVKVRGNKYVQTFYVFFNKRAEWVVARMLDKDFPKPEKGKGKRKKQGGKARKARNHPIANDFN
ncbi:TPA: hypothetical protein DEB00_02585 [Candidatus Uhrbacteria bacterium]|nr:hypothetical protein [Candidatus Uhrbacteria bacterium]